MSTARPRAAQPSPSPTSRRRVSPPPRRPFRHPPATARAVARSRRRLGRGGAPRRGDRGPAIVPGASIRLMKAAPFDHLRHWVDCDGMAVSSTMPRRQACLTDRTMPAPEFHMTTPRLLLSTVMFSAMLGAGLAQDGKEEWIVLFNGKDTPGWKLRGEKITVTKLFDADGNAIPDAKKAKFDQKEIARDAKGKVIAGAKVVVKDKKQVVVDADGNPLAGAKVVKVGGRDAI